MGKKKEKRRSASYFIDFENVRGAGLDGVENLREGDRVTVLYGSRDSALKIDQVKHVMASPAKVEFIQVATGKHDALDFQLVALLFMKMKKSRDYFIISKDTGFDFAIHMAREKGIERVYRRESISGTTLEPKKLPGRRRKPQRRLPQPRKQGAQNAAEGQQNGQQRDDKPQQQQEQQRDDKPQQQQEQQRDDKPQQQADSQPQVAQGQQQAQTDGKPQQGQQPQAAQGEQQAQANRREQRGKKQRKQDIPAQDNEQSQQPDQAQNEPAQEKAQNDASQAEGKDSPRQSSSKRRRRRSSGQRSQQRKDAYRRTVEQTLSQQLEELPPAKQIDAILAALEACDTKTRFYNFLRKQLGNEEGRALYANVKGSFEELRAIERPNANQASPAKQEALASENAPANADAVPTADAAASESANADAASTADANAAPEQA